MSLMKKAIRGLALATALTATGMAANAQDVTLKLHQFLPQQANVPKYILDPWIERVQEASGGALQINHFPSMQLGGKPPELIGQVQDGVADIAWTVLGYTPGRFPQAEVFELPFMMNNAEATSRAFWEFAEANMFESDLKDFKILGLWVHGPGLIHSKEPITDVADLNGVKLRAPTRIINKMVSDLGATPVGMPVPAVPEALSKGVIDAAVIPWEVTAALKVPELVGNHTEFGNESLYTTAFVLVMNKQKYESLSDEMKAAIDGQSGADFSALAGKTQAEGDIPARKLAAEAGNNIITLTDAQVAEWKAAASGVEAGWVEEMNGKGFDGQALLDQAKDLIKKNGM